MGIVGDVELSDHSNHAKTSHSDHARSVLSAAVRNAKSVRSARSAAAASVKSVRSAHSAAAKNVHSAVAMNALSKPEKTDLSENHTRPKTNSKRKKTSNLAARCASTASSQIQAYAADAKPTHISRQDLSA